MFPATSWRGVALALLLSGAVYGAHADSSPPIPVAAEAAAVSLRQWLHETVFFHPDIESAQARVDAARQRLAASGQALYNPEMELDVESSQADTYTIGVNQTIDWGRRGEAQRLVAGAALRHAEWRLRAEENSVAATLLIALADYHTRQALDRVATKGLQRLQRSARLAAERYEAGDLGQVELDLAKLNVAQARFRQAQASAERLAAREKLRALAPDSQAWPMLFTPPAPAMATDALPERVMALPSMQAARQRVLLAGEKVRLRQARQSVNPTIGLRAGREDETTLVGLNLSIPLPLRNDYQAEVAVAAAEKIEAQRQAASLYRRLSGELKAARGMFQTSRQAWLDWQESAADTLSGQVRLLERLWQAGELDTMGYLLQLNQALETRRGAIEQQGRMWRDWAVWLRASGQIRDWLQAVKKENRNE